MSGYRLAYRGEDALRRPLLLAGSAAAACCCAGRRCRTRRRSTGSCRPRTMSPGSWSATPTSTTPSTRPPSRGASAAGRTGRSSLGALMALHGLGEQAVEVEPYRTYELGPVRGQLRAQRPLEAAARAGRAVLRRADLRAPRRASPRAPTAAARSGGSNRGRRHHALPPGQRRPDRRRGPRIAAWTSSWPGSPAATSPSATGSGSCRGSIPRWSSRRTTTTSSCRSASEMELIGGAQIDELPDEVSAVSRDATSALAGDWRRAAEMAERTDERGARPRRWGSGWPPTSAPGDVVLVSGELGAGKTTLDPRRLSRRSGSPTPVTSPTFTIGQRYRGARAGLPPRPLPARRPRRRRTRPCSRTT